MSLSLCLCIQPHARVSLVDQLLEKLGQVAETMRLCANVADDFARTMSGKTLNPGVNPFSDVVSSVGQKTGKRKAQTLDDEQKKYTLGSSTSYNVVLRSRDLTAAQGTLLRDRINLVEAEVNFNQAMGRTLDVDHVTIADAKGANVSRVSSIP